MALMLLRIASVFPAALMLAACSWSDCEDCDTVGGEGPPIKGSGIAKTESRPVEKFTAIHLSEVTGSLEIERTGSESLTVTADDNVVSRFTSEVKDGTLYLSIARGNSVRGKRPVYKITVSDLRKLDIEGAASIKATKLDGDDLSISIAGAAAGNVAGRSDHLSITISGAGTFNAAELKAKRAKVVVRGVGQVTVNASDELDGEVSGAGIIWYIGSPKLKSNVDGIGAIKQKPF
jgi:Putative auto-transporter adhesin, head GIN domain